MEPNTRQPFDELCASVKRIVPSAVGPETWYLIIATVLTASPNPASLGDFYTYLTTTTTTTTTDNTAASSLHSDDDTSFATPERQSLLSDRLRDVLLKLVTLLGAPSVVVAISALAKAEGDPQRKSEGSELSKKWQNVDMTHIRARGTVTIDSIYGRLLPKIFAGFGAHSQDIQHMVVAGVYGLYLSDHSVLTALETEVVAFAAILCTGLRSPGLWHMRGLGRLLGARGADAENSVKDVLRGCKMAVMACVEFCGEEMERRVGGLHSWPNVGDVARELGGFGEDPFVQQVNVDGAGRLRS